MKKIVVVGSSNTDMIMQLPNIPRPGETLSGGVFTQAAGGKGANQAVAVARAGGAVAFVAKVGQDEFGNQALAGFCAEGIAVSAVTKTAHAASGMAFIFVDAKGENSIGVAGGANDLLTPEDIMQQTSQIEQADILLIQLETPIAAVQKAIALAHVNHKMVILNPAPARVLSEELLAQVDILTPNETEAELLTGIVVSDEASAQQAAQILLGKGVKKVLITVGKQGVWVAENGQIELVPGFEVEARDTTAAGDTFNGALAVALAEDKDLKSAVRFGQAAAAISVTRLGAQPSVPTRNEIEEFLNKN
ncbi:ribokinase [Reichenbachiella carrageenanivorans]|uniref:Ribokinase n=1 Tax=Reichenbachiella carrageenanivorans TaxID=2979869 RepID=A0ABY6D4H6_9BACT|nr:ribokinase [Reichenbachiella carrageenanivorans]UXX81051.1 ribokinase [Reichenbachiella carrageenanivorans]